MDTGKKIMFKKSELNELYSKMTLNASTRVRKKNHFIENVMCVFKWQFLGENHFLILKKNLAIT